MNTGQGAALMEPATHYIGFHIYYGALNVGGVETMLLRLSNWLVAQGHGVCLHVKADGELDGLLDPRVERRVGREGQVTTRDCEISSSTCGSARSHSTVVFAPEPWSMVQAMRRHRHLGVQCRFLLGVYHPRIFFILGPEQKLAIRREIVRTLIREPFMMFMNDGCRRQHEIDFKQNFCTSTMVPPPMDDPGMRSGNVTSDKIVSVGRLVDFKTYNLHMIEVVAELVRRGHRDVEWHVYGDGPLLARMKGEVALRCLQDRVFLHGTIPYPMFSSAVQDAKVFVGMGTSLIQAGLAGVPSIVAIDDSATPFTYGPVESLAGFNCGEREDRSPSLHLADAIESVITANEDDYRAASIRARVHCERFLIDRVGPLFVEAALRAMPWTQPTPELQSLIDRHDLRAPNGRRSARVAPRSSVKDWLLGWLRRSK